MAQEDTAAGALGPAPLQVAGQRLADVGGKGQAVLTGGLPAHKGFAAPPIEIVKLEANDLSAPQPEADQQGQDGVVTAPECPAPVAAPEQLCRLTDFDRPRPIR